MNFRFLLATLFCFFSAITSCSNKTNIENIADKQAYITQIEKLSDTDRKQQLEKDIDLLQQCLAICKKWSPYYGFASSSSGDPSIGIKNEEDAANPFKIFSVENYNSDFEQINKNSLSAYQKITESDSNFDFYPKQVSFKYINNSNLKYTIKEVFARGNKSNTLTNRLLPVDSLAVEVSYSYPIAFDSITIKKGQQGVVYNNDTIKVEYYDSNDEVNLDMPTNLNIIGYRAIDSYGKLMSENQYANYPITSFSPSVIAQAEDGLDLLKKALKATDKAQSIAYLKEIPDDTFNTIGLILAFNKDLEEFNKKEESSEDTGFKELFNTISGLELLMKKYDSILEQSIKKIQVRFPRPFTKIYLYVATQSQICDTTFVVKTTKDNLFPYNVFTDNTETKYGIANDKGEVIIPATYSKIYQSDTLYFRITEGENEFSAYLNPDTKKLETLPKDLNIIKKLNNNLLVFSNKENNKGVLKNLEEEIIPFKYNKITIVGKTIVAQGLRRGREYYEFYSLDGKLLDIPPVDDINYNEDFDSGIIIVSKVNKYGFINKEGEMTIAPQYRDLGLIGDDLLKYQTNNDSISLKFGFENKKYLYGLVNGDGHKISKPIYLEIEPFQDNRAMVQILVREDDYGQYRLSGFIDTKGTVIIEPQYEKANDFHKGYALVSKDYNSYFLIDNTGNIVKIFEENVPVDLYEEDTDDSDKTEVYYKTEKGEIFNYKGDKIK